MSRIFYDSADKEPFFFIKKCCRNDKELAQKGILKITVSYYYSERI